MNANRKYLLIIFLAIIFCAAKHEKTFDEYHGGAFGHSGLTLRIYHDSTYSYSEWNDAGGRVNDNGKWGKRNQYYYLNSIKTERNKGNRKSRRILRFEMQQFTITADTLKLIPNNEKDADYFDAYYTFYKVK